MKRTLAVMVCAMLCSVLIAGTPGNPGKANEAFEKIKSLEGTWKGTGDEGKPLTITYALVSNGTAVMESIDSEEHKGSMITMYHCDGDRLVMTHYCSMGNQPHMRAAALTPDGKLAFAFVGGSNMKKTDAHMHALTFTFKGNDAFTQDWTMQENGKDKMHAIMTMTRVP
jgi:hypothetical protein